jgi:hypothetical protein
VIKLAEDDSAMFEHILEYIYCGKLNFLLNPSIYSEGVKAERLRVVKTYILADKLCMEALSNSLVDLYRAMCVGTHLSDRELVMVARLASPHTQLRAFVF